MASKPAVLLSCDHAVNHVPRAYAGRIPRRLLRTHRAYDVGALTCARQLQRHLRVPLVAGSVTRLLIDLNRSATHPRVWSPYSRKLTAQQRAHIMAQYYTRYRAEILRQLRAALRRAPHVVHVAVHTFTPRLHGVTRRADVGLLYDPRRAPERALCARWRAALQTTAPRLRARMNYPYRGTADGLPTWLRRRFSAQHYRGIELEVNQALIRRRLWRSLPTLLSAALTEALCAKKTENMRHTLAH